MPTPEELAAVPTSATSLPDSPASPSTSQRNWGQIVGIAATAFLLGVALPAAFIVGAGANNPTAAGPETPPTTATVTATATMIVTSKVTETVTPSTEPAEGESVAESLAPAQPRGALLVQAGPEGGFGQSFPEGKCAVWRTGFINQSDTAIDQITMAPPGGEYTGEWNGHSYQTRPAAKPAPAVLNVFIAPGQSAALEYKTCTSTPSPGSTFEYGAHSPEYLTFRWQTGQTGRACFKC